jgi:hypothetical protein
MMQLYYIRYIFSTTYQKFANLSRSKETSLLSPLSYLSNVVLDMIVVPQFCFLAQILVSSLQLVSFLTRDKSPSSLPGHHPRFSAYRISVDCGGAMLARFARCSP